MTAPHIVDPAGLLSEALLDASPDLMRSLLQTMINALLLLVGLMRRGSYKPLPGWGGFILQVLASTALLAVFLMWAASSLPWMGPSVSDLQRIGMLGLVLLGSAVLYFAVLWAAGLKVRQLLRR